VPLRSSRIPVAYALAPVVVALAGCDGREIKGALDELFFLIVLVMVAGFVLLAIMAVVLAVNIAKLAGERPSVGWGVAALVLAVIAGLGMGLLLFVSMSPFPLVGLLLVILLAVVGAKNVRDARDARAAQRFAKDLSG
jgi:hypothetical protein